MINILPLYVEVLGAIVLICIAIDAWMTSHAKSRLHERLTGWWVSIDDTGSFEYPQRAAKWFIKLEKRLFGKRFRGRGIFVALSISIVLTTLAVVIAEISYAYTFPYWDGSVLGAVLDRLWEVQAFGVPSYAETDLGWVYVVTAYVINFGFDLVTILITVYLLNLAVENPRVAIPIFIADGVAAVTLAILCGATSIHFLYGDVIISGWNPSISGYVGDLADSATTLFAVLTAQDFTDSVGTYSSTTLIPTLLYLSVLILLYLSKPIVTYLRRLAAWIVARLVEDPDPKSLKPFTLLAVLIAAVAGLLNVVAVGLQ